jgi:hypothetical protein
LFISTIRFPDPLEGVARQEVVSAFCWQSTHTAANLAATAFLFNM